MPYDKRKKALVVKGETKKTTEKSKTSGTKVVLLKLKGKDGVTYTTRKDLALANRKYDKLKGRSTATTYYAKKK